MVSLDFKQLASLISFLSFQFSVSGSFRKTRNALLSSLLFSVQQPRPPGCQGRTPRLPLPPLQMHVVLHLNKGPQCTATAADVGSCNKCYLSCSRKICCIGLEKILIVQRIQFHPNSDPLKQFCYNTTWQKSNIIFKFILLSFISNEYLMEIYLG